MVGWVWWLTYAEICKIFHSGSLYGSTENSHQNWEIQSYLMIGHSLPIDQGGWIAVLIY